MHLQPLVEVHFPLSSLAKTDNMILGLCKKHYKLQLDLKK